mgnify:CR=1 FL=1
MYQMQSLARQRRAMRRVRKRLFEELAPYPAQYLVRPGRVRLARINTSQYGHPQSLGAVYFHVRDLEGNAPLLSIQHVEGKRFSVSLSVKIVDTPFRQSRYSFTVEFEEAIRKAAQALKQDQNIYFDLQFPKPFPLHQLKG